MKKHILLLITLITTLLVLVQCTNKTIKPQIESHKTQVINSQFDWKTNFSEAKELANSKNQKIILVFSGSDWCTPCIKLEKEIWSSTFFKTYAKDNFVMLKADFPKRKKNKLSEELQKSNNLLAEQYNPNGFFPLVVILNSEGKVLGTTGYKKISPEEYVNLLNSF